MYEVLLMDNQENIEFFDNLTRKELQSLCKKHGVVANKSKSQLAKLLNSYYKNCVAANDVPINVPAEDSGCSDCETHELSSESPLVASPYDESVLNFQMKKPPKSVASGENNQNPLSASRDGVETMPNLQQGNPNSGMFPSDRVLVSSNQRSTEVRPPSFEFHVRSEDGINLSVDLSSSPSELLERLKNEVCFYPQLKNTKPWVLQRDIRNLGENAENGRSSVLENAEVNVETTNGLNYIESSSSPIVRKSRHLGFDHLRSGPRISGNLVISQTKPPGNFLTNLNSGVSKLFDSSAHQPKSGGAETIPIQTSVSRQNRIFEGRILPINAIPERPTEMYPRPSTSDSMGKQLSEAARYSDDILNSPNKDHEAPALDHPVNDSRPEIRGSANYHLDQNTCINPLHAEERGGSKSINETESSQSSETKSLLKRTRESSKGSGPEKLQRKRSRKACPRKSPRLLYK